MQLAHHSSHHADQVPRGLFWCLPRERRAPSLRSRPSGFTLSPSPGCAAGRTLEPLSLSSAKGVGEKEKIGGGREARRRRSVHDERPRAESASRGSGGGDSLFWALLSLRLYSCRRRRRWRRMRGETRKEGRAVTLNDFVIRIAPRVLCSRIA